MSHNILCHPIWSEWIPYIAHVAECLAVYCLCGQSVSRYVALIRAVYMVGLSHHMLLMWPACLTIYCVDSRGLHDLTISRYIAQIARLTIYCSCGQYVSPYIAHVVKVSHSARYQFILSRWSVCLTICCPHGQDGSHISRCVIMDPIYCEAVIMDPICCIVSCCPHDQNGSQCHCICDRHVSPYIMSIHIVYTVGLDYHVLPVWSRVS